jgi:hypothetical protein
MKHLLSTAALGAGLLLSGCSGSQPASVELSQPPTAPSMAGPTPTLEAAPQLAAEYMNTITADELAAHLYFFADDLLEGRETSARGQKIASRYLASQYRMMGLEAKGSMRTDDGRNLEAFLQPFPVYGQRLAQATLSAEMTHDGTPMTLTSTFAPGGSDGNSMLAWGGQPQASGGVVFAGYGITADDTYTYDDYAAMQAAGIDYSGKWLLVLGDEPRANDGTAILSPDGMDTRWSTNAFERLRAVFGSRVPFAGMLVVTGDSDVDGPFEQRAINAADRSALAVGSLSLNPPNATGQRPGMFYVSETFADGLLMGSGMTVDELRRQIRTTEAPVVMELEDVTLSSTVQRDVFEADTENVVAMLEGSDPVLKDEVLVISSHYDHIGISTTATGDDVINNGADDDGSGTVSVLEIAEAFAQAQMDGVGPRRSIVFLNVSGEEKGLLGSAYYADVEPAVPIAQTIANLNIDMIGRRDPTYDGDQPDNYVYVIGSELISPDIDALSAMANEVAGINMDLSKRFNSPDDPNQFYRRSDHWNFGKSDIPFIFYFNGTHEDYHGLDDEPNKIDYEQMQQRARLIFATAWQLANQDGRPEAIEDWFAKAQAAGQN